MSATEILRREKQSKQAKRNARETRRRKIIRWPRLLEIIPLGETLIRDTLIATGKLKPVPLGRRAVGFVEDEVFEINEELIAARDSAAKSKAA
jgi:predicted DNA-binding transcriptional regulator AlpA